MHADQTVRELVRLYYFSGTGNTRWAARQFAEVARRSGAECELVPVIDRTIPLYIEDGDANSHRRPEVIGVAFPIYGADLPPIIKRFFERLSAALSTVNPVPSIFALATYGYVDALGPRYIERIVEGVDLRWYHGVHLVNNITTPKRPAPIPPPKVVERRKRRALTSIEDFASVIVSGGEPLPRISPPRLVGPIVRLLTRPAVTEHYTHIGVDRDRCVLCKLCVEQCPTESITYTQQRFHVDDRCTACMRCYSSCPVHAITIDGRYADPAVYPRHHGL